jgi:hypothetical protein
MKKILHHFRRNRSYAKHEQWLTVGAMLVLTIIISTSSWLLFGKPASSATSLEVVETNISKTHVVADSTDMAEVNIILQDKATLTPATGVWVGLAIPKYWQSTDALTYNDWYSFEPNRAFYQTDENGKVNFKMKSALAGAIEYQIYVANPELKNDNKYQKLPTSFTINFE